MEMSWQGETRESPCGDERPARYENADGRARIPQGFLKNPGNVSAWADHKSATSRGMNE